MVAQRRMSLAGLLTRPAQRYTLIKQAVVPDFSRFPNHHAHPVIDEEPPPDGRARMNFNARNPPRHLRNQPRQQRYPSLIQRMSHPVEKHGVQPGVTEEYLDNALGGGVLAEDCVDLFFDRSEHAVPSII
jgi:hypothetical protein